MAFAHGLLAGARKRLQAVEGEISRLVDAIATVSISSALQARLQPAEQEREQLQAQLRAAVQTSAPEWTVDAVMAQYRRVMMGLQAVLEGVDDRDLARNTLASAIGPLELVTDESGAVFVRTKEKPAVALTANGGYLEVVAGAGFEPTTFGL